MQKLLKFNSSYKSNKNDGSKRWWMEILSWWMTTMASWRTPLAVRFFATTTMHFGGWRSWRLLALLQRIFLSQLTSGFLVSDLHAVRSNHRVFILVLPLWNKNKQKSWTILNPKTHPIYLVVIPDSHHSLQSFVSSATDCRHIGYRVSAKENSFDVASVPSRLPELPGGIADVPCRVVSVSCSRSYVGVPGKETTPSKQRFLTSMRFLVISTPPASSAALWHSDG